MQTVVLVYYRSYSGKGYGILNFVSQLSLPLELVESLDPHQLQIYLCGYMNCYPDDFIGYEFAPISAYPVVWEGGVYDN